MCFIIFADDNEQDNKQDPENTSGRICVCTWMWMFVCVYVYMFYIYVSSAMSLKILRVFKFFISFFFFLMTLICKSLYTFFYFMTKTNFLGGFNFFFGLFFLIGSISNTNSLISFTFCGQVSKTVVPGNQPEV